MTLYVHLINKKSDLIKLKFTGSNKFYVQIGPIPLEDGIGKEVITRMTANMATDKVFYTDSNGRDFLKRVSLVHNFAL